MKVLMLGSDAVILQDGTEARERMRWYASAFDELHVVVMGHAMPYVDKAKFSKKLSFIERSVHATADTKAPNLYLYHATAGTNTGLRFALFLAARQVLRSATIDVISVQSPDEVGLVGYFLARRFRVPLQIQIHTDVFSPHYRRAGVKERIRYHVARWLIPRASCIRVVSERIKNSILGTASHELGAEISVFPIYTNISRFQSAARDLKTDERFKEYDFKMIAIGRFVDKEKNFTMLINIMREFVKVCPKALLVIAGDGPDRVKYESRIRNYGLENNITLEKWRDDLPSFFKSFDLYVLSSDYEGWGRTVIEAMAAGLPVVMTDVGLAGEIVRHNENGIVVAVGDQDGFVQALVGILRDPARLRQLREGAKKTAEAIAETTLSTYLQKYRDVFICCVAMKRAPQSR